jgi:uncharacterized protein YdeI (YjbR/CyaY-like superfamily)
VVVTIDRGFTYRNTIASMGGRYLISFSSEVRAATGRRAGDEVEVTLAVDDATRTVDVPSALADALATDPVAAAAWATRSYSKQRAHALSVEQAKTDDTRVRRVQKVIDALHA